MGERRFVLKRDAEDDLSYAACGMYPRIYSSDEEVLKENEELHLSEDGRGFYNSFYDDEYAGGNAGREPEYIKVYDADALAKAERLKIMARAMIMGLNGLACVALYGKNRIEEPRDLTADDLLRSREAGKFLGSFAYRPGC